MPTVTDPHAALQGLARALGRETHVLVGRADLLWQQLHNRLQWESAAVAALSAAERESRSGPSTAPWARTRTPFRESEALVRTLAGHSDEVHACAVSPDGAWVVSASEDETLRVWDAVTGVELRTLTGHTSTVDGCAVSPDGSWIVSASNDETLKVWDAATGAELHTLTGHSSGVGGCAVSPDGSWIVSAGWDGTLKVWDAATGAELRTLTGHTEDSVVTGCAVSPDGSWIVSASNDETLKVWDVATGAELHTLTGHTGDVTGCAVSPDGAWVVSASGDETLKIWNVATGAELRTLTGHTGRVEGCAVSPDGAWVVSASEDHTLKVWDAATGAELRTLTGHAVGVMGQGEVYGCAVSPDGTRIVSASGDHTLKVWDAASGGELRTPTGHTAAVSGCAVSPDGTWVVSASYDMTLKVWDAATGAELRTLTGRPITVTGCAVSPNGSWIVSAGGDGTLTVWDPGTGTELRTLTGHTGGVHGCAVSPDGSWIVSASGDHTLKMWDAATGTELRTLAGHDGLVNACAVSPDGSWIVSASGDHTLKVWDEATGTELRTLTGHTDWVTGCAVSPDGTWVVSASWDQTLKVWDAATGTELRTLTGHTWRVHACAVSPDGSWIVSVGADNTLRVWDAGAGTETLTVPLLGASSCVGVHPHRPMVVCGDEGGGVYLLDLIGIQYGPAPDDSRPAPDDEVVSFCPEGLLHKFGFGDGDILVELMEENHLEVDRSDLLVAVVERLVVPRLDQQVETYTLVSSHNPIRASTVDGVQADLDSVLTPEVVEVRVAEILEVAGSLATPRELGHLDRLDGQVLASGPAGLLDEIDTAPPGENDAALQIVRGAVVLSAGALTGDRTQLPGQLLGRLRSVPDPEVQELVADAEVWLGRPWLRPLTASLSPPGERLAGILRGQSDFITAVALCPDGRLVASGTYGRDVRVWDLKRGTEVCRFEGERPSSSYAEGAGGDAIVALAFSGGALVAASADRCAYSIDPVTGVGRMVVPGETDNLFAVSLSADGRTMVAAPRDIWGYTDDNVQVWDAVDGRRLHSMEGPQGLTSVTAASGDGRVAASAGSDAALLLWDARLGRLLSREEGGARSCIALSEDGTGLALGAEDGMVVVRHRAGDPTSATRLSGHTGPVNALAFAGPDRLVAGSKDGTVTVWDLHSGQQVAELPAQGSGVRSVTGSRDGRWLVSGLADGSVRVWDLDGRVGAAGRVARSHRGAVTAAAVGDDGTNAVTMGADGEVLRWDVSTGDAVPVMGGDDATLADVAGLTPELVRLRERVLRRDEEEFGGGQGENHTLTGAAVSADGHWALTSSTHWTMVFYRLGIAREDTYVRLWNLRRGEQERVLAEATRNLVHGGHVDAFRCVAIDRTGTLGAAGGDDHTVRVWDLSDGEFVASFTGESVITSCALSPEGRLLVAGEASGRVHLLRLEGRQ